MKRRTFLGGLLGTGVAAYFGMGSSESKPSDNEPAVKEPSSENEPLQEPKEEPEKKVEESKPQEPIPVKEKEPITPEEKESVLAETDVLQAEFRELVNTMTPETKALLERFYRNKHQKQSCPDIIALLKSEMKRITQKEQEHLMEARFGNNETILKKYLRPFSENKLKLISLAKKAEHTTGVPFWLILGVIGIESGGNPKAKNDNSGAAGLMQLMPDTARDVLGLVVDETKGIDERLDPEKCVDAGARYLAALEKKYGQLSLALVAYSSGAGSMRSKIKQAYKTAGVPAPDATSAHSLEEHGVNIVTLYSKEFGYFGTKHSVQYPLFVEAMARQIQKVLLDEKEPKPEPKIAQKTASK